MALDEHCVGRVAERSLSWMSAAEVFSSPLPLAVSSERCITYNWIIQDISEQTLDEPHKHNF